VGTMNTPTTMRAFMWSRAMGMKTLAPLGGDVSSTAMAINGAGTIAGSSSGAHGSSAVVWNADGSTMTVARDAEAHGINASGAVAGTRSHQAFVWIKGQGMQMLGALPGDERSDATAINDRGQVVGISGLCDQAVGRFSAIHAVLWDHGVGRDIGNLGGVAWNTPMAINQAGDVVGFSNVSAAVGGAFDAQAFLWTRRGGIRPLGTLPGDVYSQALGINAQRQIVGTSCTAGFATCRAFLWEDGVMTDLNTLVAPASPDELFTANDINDLGEITGQAIASNGSAVAFTATPHGAGPSVAGAARGQLLPALARRALLARSGFRPGNLLRR